MFSLFSADRRRHCVPHPLTTPHPSFLPPMAKIYNPMTFQRRLVAYALPVTTSVGLHILLIAFKNVQYHSIPNGAA
jgi:hypothetical protein